LKNRFSTAIIGFHSNRTLGGVCSKVRQLELLFHSALDDEKTKIFSTLSNRAMKEKKKKKKKEKKEK